MVFKRFKLILGIFIPVFCFFVMSHNTFATKAITGGNYGYKINNGNGSTGHWTGTPPVELLTGVLGTNKYLYGYNVTGTVYNEFSGTYPTNIVRITTTLGCTNSQNLSNGCSTTYPGNEAVTITGTTHNGNSITGSCVIDDTGTAQSIRHKCNLVADGYDYPETFSITLGYTTVYTHYPIASICGGVQCMSSAPIGSVRIEAVNIEVDSSRDPNTGLLQEQINQNTTIINQNQQVIDENNAAYDNISNQSAGDISGATSSQTTSIIGVISSFVTSLSSINATSCDLSLPFPEFLGGDTVVTPCSGKEKAPALITIGSSMLLIGVFIPLAWIVLRMIYNEIRSWTNG